jgi:tyrosyl-tRNA synthetase
MIQGGGLTVNDERIAAPDAPVPAPIAGEWFVVRVGKRRVVVGRVAG